MKMSELVIKVPDMGEEALRRFSVAAERAVLQEWRREEMSRVSNELLEESGLSDEDALELGRRMKKGRFKKLKEMGLV